MQFFLSKISFKGERSLVRKRKTFENERWCNKMNFPRTLRTVNAAQLGCGGEVHGSKFGCAA